MKRIIPIFAVLMLAFSQGAFSQNSGEVLKSQDGSEYTTYIVKWYEDLDAVAQKFKVSPEIIVKYNGLVSTKLKKQQTLKIPLHPEDIVFDDPSAQEQNLDYSENAENRPTESEDVTAMDKSDNEGEGEDSFNFGNLFKFRQESVNAALIMPFNANGNPSANYLDFYSGVLLATKDVAEADGIEINLEVYDCSDREPDEMIFYENDVIIGPVSSADFTGIFDRTDIKDYIISPLDPKVAELAATRGNLIQAPSSADAQNRDLIEWIRKDWSDNDRLILFAEKNAAPTQIKNLADSCGLPVHKITYNILEGRNLEPSLTAAMTLTGKNRILIASESEAFVNDVIRNLDLMIHGKYEVVLYAPSKFKSFTTISAESLHNVNMHLSCSHYVDYDNSKVKSFLMRYRALFNAEPTPFAYQGYDTAAYFIKCRRMNGKKWDRAMTDKREKGLQQDFLFVRNEEGSLCNTAVRRVVYGEEYSIKIVN